LKLLLENETMRAVWKNWASDYVQQFNWPAIVDRYEAFYEEAIKERNERER
jgi:glycosyltransferase involved in cell wall biosynthesis